MLVFVWDGYLFAVRWWGEETARRLSRLAMAVAIGMPIAIGAVHVPAATVWVRDFVRPLSPMSTNPRPVMAAAAFGRSTIAPANAGVVVDIDGPISTSRWSSTGGCWRIRCSESGRAPSPGVERERPLYLVRFDEGQSRAAGRLRVAGTTLMVRGLVYEELDGFGPPVHVYRRAADQCQLANVQAMSDSVRPETSSRPPSADGNGKMTVCPASRVRRYEHALRSQPAPYWQQSG